MVARPSRPGCQGQNRGSYQAPFPWKSGSVPFTQGRINELKIDYGPGYRVYYTFKGKALILLLCGGDKSSQSKDIRLATEISACWES
ncbi:MAG: hypothetical protein RBR77_13350 [Thauera sp.]|nr:hypothetical protein [Thauera sp.]